MSIGWFAQLLGLTLASAALGLLCCWALWSAFKLIHHPEWGQVLIAIPVAFGLAGKLPDSEFLLRILTFAVAFAGPFWIAGLVWRVDFRDRLRAERTREYSVVELDLPSREAKANALAKYRMYPVIAGCIYENRRPSPAELKWVTQRILREAFVAPYPTLGFAEKRAALRAARAALEGS